MMLVMARLPSLALPTLYPKSRVVGSGLFRYVDLWHCDQKLVYPIRMRFELAKAGKTNCCR